MKILKITGIFTLIAVATLILATLSFYRSDLPASEAEKKYLTPESTMIEIMDARMHIRIRGTGEPIFLIHGSFASLHTWEHWENELIKSFKTISIDLPGHGLTGPNRSNTYSQEYYRDIVFALADSLGIEKFSVAGNSMGGNVAIRMAQHQPDRIIKLILVDAAGSVKAQQPNLLTKNSKINQSKRPWIFGLLSHPVGGKLLTRFTPRFLFKMNLQQVYGDPSLITEELIDRYYELLIRDGNRVATIQRLTGGQSNSGIGKNITCPTLIIWGKKDRWIPLSNGERIHQEIPGSKLVIFPHAGHVPHEEIPGESVLPVLEFLQQPAEDITLKLTK